ncbi:MAG: ABC transporter ATP-binding protein [Rhodocyclaceae bacterium]
MLSIQQLAYRYPGAPQAALDGVTLGAARGQILGLLGPNGAGKTTLISHLAGRLAVQQGAILIDGTPLDEIRRRTPTRIALAPQEYAFYPMLSVRENLDCFAAAARLSGTRRQQRIADCLAFTQLERFAHTRGEALSGGLKRRLNLAIALLPEPDLILLDEPTVGVDPQSRAFILDAVRSLARDGTAIIYTSHYMDEIEAIADRVAIIDHGRLLRDAPLAALLADGCARLSMVAADTAPADLAARLSAWGEAHATAEGASVHLAAPHTPAAVLAALEDAGLHLRQIRYGHDNLEHLFMRLTERSLRDD